ncbi:949_t:CDS:2, partial [Cetraspora pellucida]
ALKQNLHKKLRRTKKVKLGKQTNLSMNDETTPSTNNYSNNNNSEGNDSDKQKEIFYNPQKLDMLSNASHSKLYENNNSNEFLPFQKILSDFMYILESNVFSLDSNNKKNTLDLEVDR